jgi:hypothetical protein
VRIETVNGKEELVIGPLDKLEESPSCIALRKAVKSLLPRVDLPETLLEIHFLTGFTNEFCHNMRLSSGRSMQYRLGVAHPA